MAWFNPAWTAIHGPVSTLFRFSTESFLLLFSSTFFFLSSSTFLFFRLSTALLSLRHGLLLHRVHAAEPADAVLLKLDRIAAVGIGLCLHGQLLLTSKQRGAGFFLGHSVQSIGSWP